MNLRGRMYQATKGEAHRPGKVGQNDQVSGETREKLAARFKVSPKTIQRDAKFAERVELSDRIVAIEKPLARERQAAAGGDRKSTAAKSVRKSLPNRSAKDDSKRTTAVAAKAVDTLAGKT